MNQLYRYTPKVLLNGKQLYGRTWRLNDPLHYDEILDKPETLSYTNFDLVWKEYLPHCYKYKTIFSKKRVVVGEIDDTHRYRVTEDKVISYDITFFHTSYDIKDFTMSSLIKQLSVENFIKLCKDLHLSYKEVEEFTND